MGAKGKGAPKQEPAEKKPVGRPALPGDPAIRRGCRKLIPLALARLKAILEDESMEPRHTINAIKAVFDGAQRKVELGPGKGNTDAEWNVKLVPEWRAPGK